MLLDNCYAFSLLLYSSSLKKKFFEEGAPHWHIMALPWIRPSARFGPKVDTNVRGHEYFIPLPSLVNIHQMIL